VRVHEALIRAQWGDQIIGHIARDSTEIEAREKHAPKVVVAAVPAAPPGLFDGVMSDQEGHVPLIDHNVRRGEKIEFVPHEAQRYKTPSQPSGAGQKSVERQPRWTPFARTRRPKVYTHLMFGILMVAAEQILRLLN
jgi:hypothetical protein